MKLIVGLGNPGLEYNNTRHNVGFLIMDLLAKKYNFEYTKNKFNGLYFEKLDCQEKIIFLKPQKYMNLSGEVIRDYLKFYKISIEDMIVFVDDLDLPCGKIRVKKKGSSGGHNGLKDIEKNIGTQIYNRVKVGIANDKNIDTKNYVLGKLSKEELQIVNDSAQNCCDIVEDFLNYDMDYLMSKYN